MGRRAAISTKPRSPRSELRSHPSPVSQTTVKVFQPLCNLLAEPFCRRSVPQLGTLYRNKLATGKRMGATDKTLLRLTETAPACDEIVKPEAV